MSQNQKVGSGRGRKASSPTELTGAAWKDVALRVWGAFSDDRVMMIAAGATFYALLALVPALAALVAIYGLVFDQQSVVDQVSALSEVLAPEVRTIIQEQLTRLASEPSGSLSTAFVVSLGISIWSASSATKAIMEGLNVVYDEEEKRGFLSFYGTALLLTLAGLIGAIVVLSVTLVVPVVVRTVFPGANEAVLQAVSYAILLVFLWLGLMVLYRWGPSRDPAEWRWLTPGTVIALILLAVASVLFSWFATAFAGYSSYGSLGAVIAFMTWAWICMIILLLGAEVNAEAEHQTVRDTTVGESEPRGSRGAVMADTLGEASGSDQDGKR